MVDFVFALEQWLAGEQLAKDAADAPHVDGLSVGLCAEEELWRAVPEGDDELGQVRGRGVAYVACHAKVCDFQDAAVGEQEVGGLEVAVEDVVRVQVGDTRDQLKEEAFGF